jgi:hypothetical protein
VRLQAGEQTLQRGRCEVGEEDVGVEIEVRIEQVAGSDVGLDAGLGEIRAGLVGQFGVGLHARDDGAPLGGGEQHLAVTATEVDQSIAGDDSGEIQRGFDRLCFARCPEGPGRRLSPRRGAAHRRPRGPRC